MSERESSQLAMSAPVGAVEHNTPGQRDATTEHAELASPGKGRIGGSPRLRLEQVEEIRRRRRAGEMVKRLAAEFDVSRETITCITTGKTWRGERRRIRPPVGEVNPAAKLSEDDVRAIRRLVRVGESYASIARRFCVHRPTVRSIAIGRSWSHLAWEPEEVAPQVSPVARLLSMAAWVGFAVAVDEGIRPTRAECKSGPRPCPWAGCRHHRLLDVFMSGALTTVDPRARQGRPVAVRPWPALRNAWIERMAERALTLESSCTLDLAEEGPRTFKDIGRLLGSPKQNVQKDHAGAIVKLLALRGR